MKNALNIFVRFGGLDLKNQHGYSREQKTFHAPPAKRGFYAFPKVAQELFLVGSLDRTQPSVLPKMKHDGSWEVQDYDNYEKKRRRALFLTRREFHKSSGTVWHHLEQHVSNNNIIQRHGSWVKTTIKVWLLAFKKESVTCRASSSFETSRMFGYFSKDHLEVFFDTKV